MRIISRLQLALICMALVASFAIAAEKKPVEPWVTPQLPDRKTVLTLSGKELITKPFFFTPEPGVAKPFTIAKTPPVVDFLYIPGQTHRPIAGGCWSSWGNSTMANGKYYTAIGDHGFDAYLYEYDPAKKKIRMIADLKKVLKLPETAYTPGKVHAALGLGKDGWIYYATHNGGVRRTQAPYSYNGDWIFRTDPKTGKTEVVSEGPVGKESVPNGFIDPERMIYYGGTEQSLLFFAYDLQARKVKYVSEPQQGPQRCLLFSSSTGRVYYRGNLSKESKGVMRRYDPADDSVAVIDTDLHARAASAETPQGIVYAVDWEANLWAFDVKTEKAAKIDNLVIAKQTYITALAVDSTGRYLYYSPGAHGSGMNEGTPVIQYDLKKKTRKVIAFLTPTTIRYDYICIGTYSLVLSPDDATLFITWNGGRQSAVNFSFETCAMTAIRIPESERLVVEEVKKK